MVSRLVLAIAVAMLVFGGSAARAKVQSGPKCKDAKGRAAGLKGFALMKAFGKNMKTQNDDRLASDISKAQSNFTKLFAKAEASNGCGTNGDVGAVEVEVDKCVEGFISLIGGAATTTTTTTGGSTTSTVSTTTTGGTTTTTLPVPCELPATGQTTCWNSSGNWIGCNGTGHDGDIQAGCGPSYTDNGDGTVTDNCTGLTWEKKSDDGSINDKDNSYTWNGAFSVHVAGLNQANFAGHSDWRVPNVTELHSVVNREMWSPSVLPVFNTGCAGACTVTTCSCTVAYLYWSSTTAAVAPTLAWRVDFNYGDVTGGGKASGHYVRAVRGPD